MKKEIIIIILLLVLIVIQYLIFSKKNNDLKKLIKVQDELDNLRANFQKELDDLEKEAMLNRDSLISKAYEEIDGMFKDIDDIKRKSDFEIRELLDKAIDDKEKILDNAYNQANYIINSNKLLHEKLKFRSYILKIIRSRLDVKRKSLSEFEKSLYQREDFVENLEHLSNEKILKVRELDKEIEKRKVDLYAMEFGLYEFKYNFDISDDYKEKLEEVQEEQKYMIYDNTACICKSDWTVKDSKVKGQQMVKRNFKMMLRAFNGECDSIMSKVTYKNINTMENKIRSSYKNINKLNSVLDSQITSAFLALKIQELHLVFEHAEKLYQEKEERRIEKEQLKEEERAQNSFERELLKAEKDAEKYSSEIEKIKKKIKKSSASEIRKLNKKIKELTNKLLEVENNKRAISQAQITKSGYVYIISNIGSFGENVYKIGMTRRLEPFDRIRELNGPSVPFFFDIHAMIFSHNAPNMEMKLHRELSFYKMNRVIERKEFFKVDLDKIISTINDNFNVNVDWNLKHEAKEYRMSEKLRDEEFKNNFS